MNDRPDATGATKPVSPIQNPPPLERLQPNGPAKCLLATSATNLGPQAGPPPALVFGQPFYDRPPPFDVWSCFTTMLGNSSGSTRADDRTARHADSIAAS